MKSLLFIIESLNIGGAEKSLISLLHNIDYSLYNVSLIVLSENNSLINQIPKEVQLLSVPDIIKKLNRSFFSRHINLILLMKRLLFSLRIRINNKDKSIGDYLYWKTFGKFFIKLEKRYDAVIGWGQGIPLLYAVEKVEATYKIGWINAEFPVPQNIYSFYDVYFSKLDHIVAVSDILARKIISIFPNANKKTKVIYDIIDYNSIINLSKEEMSFSFPKQNFIIVTIARLDKRKGLHLALEAAKLLKDSRNFRWYLIGNGPEKKIITNKIKEYALENYFILLNEVVNPYPYLKNADLYVQTSLTEGFCIALTEAKMFNLPIITTDFPTAFMQIRNGVNGIIVDKKPELIKNKIMFLMDDKELRQKFTNSLSKEKKGNKEEIKKLYSLIKPHDGTACQCNNTGL